MALTGHIDILSRDRIAGWAWDADRPDAPVGLVISSPDGVIARCLADVHRADLASAGIGDGRHGFDVLLAKPLAPLQSHSISVRREGDGAHLPGSPATLGSATGLDEAARRAIDEILAAVDEPAAEEALRFLASRTEQLRDLVSLRRSGLRDRYRHRALQSQEPSPAMIGSAPAPATAPRALVIDDRLPETGRDAGSDAILSHMAALRRLGYAVTFAPSDLAGDPAPLAAAGIATCLAPLYASVEDVLRRQAGAFALVYLHRMANAAGYAALARRHQPAAELIYSVADLHFLRTARQAGIEQRPELSALSRQQQATELAAGLLCDRIITHSPVEAKWLSRRLGAAKVHVVPWAVPVRPVTRPFADRRGAAFIGNFQHQPNADAVRTLVETVLPIVWQADAAFPCHLVGRAMPDWLKQLVIPPAVATGAVADLAPVFDRVRMTIAPLSFGAGIKGKVLQSLAAGIPCVCSRVAAEGLDLPPPLSDLVTDDSAHMALIMLRLERDEAYNRDCSTASLKFVAAGFTDDATDHALRAVLRR